MHCDDKRTLFALKENIQNTWNELKNSDFKDQNLLNQLNDMISNYQDYKNNLES